MPQTPFILWVFDLLEDMELDSFQKDLLGYTEVFKKVLATPSGD